MVVTVGIGLEYCNLRLGLGRRLFGCRLFSRGLFGRGIFSSRVFSGGVFGSGFFSSRIFGGGIFGRCFGALPAIGRVVGFNRGCYFRRWYK